MTVKSYRDYQCFFMVINDFDSYRKLSMTLTAMEHNPIVIVLSESSVTECKAVQRVICASIYYQFLNKTINNDNGQNLFSNLLSQ